MVSVSSQTDFITPAGNWNLNSTCDQIRRLPQPSTAVSGEGGKHMNIKWLSDGKSSNSLTAEEKVSRVDPAEGAPERIEINEDNITHTKTGSSFLHCLHSLRQSGHYWQYKKR